MAELPFPQFEWPAHDDEAFNFLLMFLRGCDLYPENSALLTVDRYRWEQAESLWIASARNRLNSEELKAASLARRVEFERIMAEHEAHIKILPFYKNLSIAPWVACAACGARPAQCNPLPEGWSWDTLEPTNIWTWCPTCP